MGVKDKLYVTKYPIIVIEIISLSQHENNHAGVKVWLIRLCIFTIYVLMY